MCAGGGYSRSLKPAPSYAAESRLICKTQSPHPLEHFNSCRSISTQSGPKTPHDRRHAKAIQPLLSYTFSSSTSPIKKPSNSLTPTRPLALFPLPNPPPNGGVFPLQFSQLVLTTRPSGLGFTVVHNPTPGSARRTFMSNLPPQTLRRMWEMGLWVSAQTKE